MGKETGRLYKPLDQGRLGALRAERLSLLFLPGGYGQVSACGRPSAGEGSCASQSGGGVLRDTVMVLVLAFGLICQTRMTYLSLLTYYGFLQNVSVPRFRRAVRRDPFVPSVLLYPAQGCDKTGRTVTCPIPSRRARSQRAHLQHNGAFRSVRSIFLYRGRVYRIRARDAADRAAGAGGRRRVDRAQNPGETKKGSLLAGVLIILAISVTITFVSTVNLDNASNELPEGSYALHVSDLDEALTPQRVSLHAHAEFPSCAGITCMSKRRRTGQRSARSISCARESGARI